MADHPDATTQRQQQAGAGEQWRRHDEAAAQRRDTRQAEQRGWQERATGQTNDIAPYVVGVDLIQHMPQGVSYAPEQAAAASGRLSMEDVLRSTAGRNYQPQQVANTAAPVAPTATVPDMSPQVRNSQNTFL